MGNRNDHVTSRIVRAPGHGVAPGDAGDAGDDDDGDDGDGDDSDDGDGDVA